MELLSVMQMTIHTYSFIHLRLKKLTTVVGTLACHRLSIKSSRICIYEYKILWSQGHLTACTIK